MNRTGFASHFHSVVQCLDEVEVVGHFTKKSMETRGEEAAEQGKGAVGTTAPRAHRMAVAGAAAIGAAETPHLLRTAKTRGL